MVAIVTNMYMHLFGYFRKILENMKYMVTWNTLGKKRFKSVKKLSQTLLYMYNHNRKVILQFLVTTKDSV